MTQILAKLAFGDSGFDRAQALRGDSAAMAGLRQNGRYLPLSRGRPLFSEDGLGWLEADHPSLADADDPVFLGLDGGIGLFAADLVRWTPEAADSAPAGPFDAGTFHHPKIPKTHGFGDLRRMLTALSPVEAAAVAAAKALTDWHRSHAFCSVCGAASRPEASGWHRRCTVCNAQHFPRTDPVVIMLVTSGNRLLLGRSPAWPEGMYSCLAGFMEPGETVEAAVRREVAEETGVVCGAVRYLASQPWPFPASLMIGCHAQALTEDITLDPVELEDALWISREDMVSVVAGEHPGIRPPRKGAIAQFLIANWLADRME